MGVEGGGVPEEERAELAEVIDSGIESIVGVRWRTWKMDG